MSLDECFAIKQFIQQIIKKILPVKFIDEFFENYFIVKNGVITKIGESLKDCISDQKIKDLIYDEDFIYLCLYLQNMLQIVTDGLMIFITKQTNH